MVSPLGSVLVVVTVPSSGTFGGRRDPVERRGWVSTVACKAVPRKPVENFRLAEPVRLLNRTGVLIVTIYEAKGG